MKIPIGYAAPLIPPGEMKIQRILSIISALILGATAAAGAELTLVADGEVRAAIVVADKPSSAAKVGAVMLAAQIERISGAKIPVLPERYVVGAAVVDGKIEATVRGGAPEVFVLIGESGLTKMLGAEVEGLGAGGILLRTFLPMRLSCSGPMIRRLRIPTGRATR